MRDTKPKTYRVVQETIDGVPVLAERWGVPDGEVIDRLVAGELAKGSEKKSGGAREVVQDDVPDEIEAAHERAKARVGFPAGVKRGSELKAPVAKVVSRDMDLATGRIDRKPITKPNGKL